jgi:hypothetical protein
MPHTARSSQGTKFKDGSTACVKVVNIDGPGVSAASIDVTALDSAGIESLPDIPDYGEVTMDVVYDPKEATHSSILAAMAAKTVAAKSVEYPDGSSHGGNGFYTGFKPKAARGDKLAAEIKVRAAGVWTFTPAA